MDKELLIQKHFKNKLSGKEQILFDNLLANDIDFKQELIEFKDLKLVIRNEERLSLKKEFQKIDAHKKSFNWSRIAIAASFALLLSVGSYFTFKNNTFSNQELFAANFEPYRNVMHPVIRGEVNLTLIEEAFVFYENGDFTKFIETLESSKYKNKDYNFYIANAHLANGNVKEAKLILEDYITNKNVKFATKAHWYLGLIYLKQDDLKNAKMLFQKVKKASGFKEKAVLKILENLTP